ncbi:MAG: trypsin-like peptidase domain-containing protein [Bacteroidales bacterium]|nr:trypsin-like peptidase domain-containing protein [Bacteroidales bacterium]
MKRVFSLLFAVIISIISLWGQSREITLKSDDDYSSFVRKDYDQTWQLLGVASNDFFTAVGIRITINSRQEGGFNIPDNVYLSGPFGTLNPIALTVNGEDWKLGNQYHYDRGNKGNYAKVIIYFNRIPAGINLINYDEPNFISWNDIPVADNEDPVQHTDWTEKTLREYWETNRCTSIEGIYYFTTTNDKKWWGKNKHTLAIVRDGYQYKVIYLKGSNKNIWKEGDLKATFVATATPGLYKATSWHMENKINNEDFYLKFSDGFMSIYENTSNVSADFLKLFPANDVNISGGTIGSTPSSPSPSSPTVPIASGSGIFIGNKVISTNYHVINGAKKIEVSIKSGNDIHTYEAKVLATDKTNDLALITIEDEKFSGIGILPFTLNGKTRDVGTSVFTMGYPMANYMGEEVKITDGIISSKTGYEGDIVTYQISAPVQPGNSGGPLFDKNGNLIGITNAVIRSAQNVGYAIKSSYLCNLIESAPISLSLPESTELQGEDLTDQIKVLSKYIVFIKIY